MLQAIQNIVQTTQHNEDSSSSAEKSLEDRGHDSGQHNDGGLSLDIAEQSPLGESTQYVDAYTPSLLYPMSRQEIRDSLTLFQADDALGEDVWTAYEFSWLDNQGKPHVAGLRVHVPCQSAAIVESKSFKLYLNSFAMTRFDSRTEVLKTLDQDLTLAFRSPVLVDMFELNQLVTPAQQLNGVCLDEQDVRIEYYRYKPDLLVVEQEDVVVHETLYTHLFRSLCPVTSQPDWASVVIEYSGSPIARDALLKYLVSFRTHQAFHETTIEQIYCDLLAYCEPNQLFVGGYFQRRGGLDINPFRSNFDNQRPLIRLPRQ